MKKMLALLIATILVIGLAAGCGTSPAEPAADGTTAEDPMATGDASKDDPLNQDDIGEKEILVVSFGTSYNDSRVATIGGIENAVKEAFEADGWSVRRAFTSNIIIDHVKTRDGEVIDDVSEALARAQKNGVKELVVQPTHLMSGAENQELKDTLAEYSEDFKISIGDPLLTSDEDFANVADILVNVTKEFQADDTAIVFMGHGTPADNELVDPSVSNQTYVKMQEALNKAGGDNYFVGVVEDDIEGLSVEYVIDKVKAGNYKKVVLRDMMVVAGDHANNDMADPDDPESWYSRFTAEGYEVQCVLEGLGQVPEIQQIYVDHCKKAVEGK